MSESPEVEDVDIEESGGRTPAGPGRPGTSQEFPLRTVGVAAGVGLLGVFVPLVVVGVLALVVMAADPANLTLVFGGLIVLQFVLFVAVGLGYLRWRGFDWRSIARYLGIGVPSIRDIAVILVTWIAMIIATLIVAAVVTSIVPELLGIEETEPAENPAALAIEENPELIVIGVIGMFLVVGPCEEILFRGVIQNRLRERLSVVPAIVLASAIFALAHTVVFLGQDPVGIAMTLSILFVPSIGLGAIYEYTGNIVVPSLLHGFHNSVILLAIYAVAVTDAEQMTLLVSTVF